MKICLAVAAASIVMISACGKNSAPAMRKVERDESVSVISRERPTSDPVSALTPTNGEDKLASSLPPSEVTVVELDPAPAEVGSSSGGESETAEANGKPVVSNGEPLDLTTYYHTPASSFNKSQKYPWRDAPHGTQTFGNVPLQIGGMICLWGARNAESELVFPLYVEGIPVQRRFDALYLYHATFNNADDGTPVSNLIFNFDDDSYSSLEVICGFHLKDWLTSVNNTTDLADANSKLVIRRKSSMSTPDAPRELRFYISEIANPEPERVVTSIDLVSAKEQSSYCLLAITTGPAGLLKMESPPQTE